MPEQFALGAHIGHTQGGDDVRHQLRPYSHMKAYLSAKLHGLRVTDKSLHYLGSVAIFRALPEAAQIEPYEQVHVVNLANGNRWITYALPGEPGMFSLNGGGARLGEIGDICIVMTFEMLEQYRPARVVYCDEKNGVAESFQYSNAKEKQRI